MTTRLRGLPPGRAGRMWLARRLDVATRGGDLLEQKLRILLSEEQDFALRAAHARVAWESAVAELDRWTLRSALLSGERAVRLASDGDAASVDITWRLTMGVHYPAAAACTIPEPGGSAFTPDNSAVAQATAAAARVAVSGADCAVAETALASVRSEARATRRKLRALRERWIPRLAAAQTTLLLALDDEEHDEHVRLRWAATPTGDRRAMP
jgi:V/A-type H+-transporting ATPase subunit D